MNQPSKFTLYNEKPVGNISSICVIFKIENNANHTGLIIKNEFNQSRLLHFTGSLLLEPVDERCGWVELDFSEVDSEIIFEKLLLLYSTNRSSRIPYGFTDHLDVFDPNSKLYNGIDRGLSGISCSTFALAALRYCQVNLIDTSTWGTADNETVQWRRGLMNGSTLNQERRSALESELFTRRYKPIEVIAAADLFVDNPIKYNQLDNRMKIIAEKYAENK
ncbi:MAG: hypothetical protein IV090_25580 [Candidatus Sericytochromatia bacterium]|nr:hypothetical protein [Candidatus Sericytochromatia bacterium]